ncbi:hypothetical protein J3A83DRAFT_4068633, partial [Scleroderma citrinum]
HFPLSHNHFAVWAAAWVLYFLCLFYLEKSPNHTKFNNFHAGQLSESSPLLQHHISKHSQPVSSAPVVNFNVSQEIFNVFWPPAMVNPSPIHSVALTVRNVNHDLLLSASATLGSCLSVNEFCTAYSLSDAI